MYTPPCSAEVRGLATAYHQIQELLRQPLPADTREEFQDFLRRAEEICTQVTTRAAASRWARDMVGPVLAAALGAAVYLRDIQSYTSALRIFGLAGDPPLSNEAAWAIVRPHVKEAVLAGPELDDVLRRSKRRLKLPDKPDPVDVLMEMTRPRGGGFPSQVAYWMAEYFRDHADDGTPYAAMYRETIASLRERAAADDSDMLAPAHALSAGGRLQREDWEEIIAGRVPQGRIALRAAFTTVRSFFETYWAKWNPDRPNVNNRT